MLAGRRPVGKPYSVDLRERVVAAVRTGGMSCRAAKQFGLGASTAIRWVQRLRETSSLAPGTAVLVQKEASRACPLMSVNRAASDANLGRATLESVPCCTPSRFMRILLHY